MFKTPALALTALTLGACAPELDGDSAADTTGATAAPLIVASDIPELSLWHTIVFRASHFHAHKASYVRHQLTQAGASAVVMLPEIAVAFARFENSDDLENVHGGIVVDGVEEVGGMQVFAVPGMPNALEALQGATDWTSIVQASQERAQDSGTATSGSDGASAATDGAYGLDWGLRRIGADQAWDITTGSHATVVAVIDTGIAGNHPDLSDNLLYRACSTFSSMTSLGSCDVYPTTGTHGTHVAGTIAGSFGAGEVIGVGPNLGLASYNVFENLEIPADIDGDGDAEIIYLPYATDANILQAVIDAADQGFQVENLSLGGSSITLDADGRKRARAAKRAWRRAIKYAAHRGTTVVVAAGNDGDVTGEQIGIPEIGLLGDLDSGKTMTLPAEAERAVTVGASGIRGEAAFPQPGATDVRVFYSSFGEVVDIAAPGGDFGPLYDGTDETRNVAYGIISSTVALDPFFDSIIAGLNDIPATLPACIATESCAPEYAFFTGTSMATPHVAGTVGLMYEVTQNQSKLTRRAAAILRQTAEFLEHDAIDGIGTGVIDTQAAVKRAADLHPHH